MKDARTEHLLSGSCVLFEDGGLHQENSTRRIKYLKKGLNKSNSGTINLKPA